MLSTSLSTPPCTSIMGFNRLGWRLGDPLRSPHKTARHVSAQADRRGPKGAAKQQRSGDKTGSSAAAGRSGNADARPRERASRDSQRSRELQREAQRASARAEGVGAGRLALQERLALQPERDVDYNFEAAADDDDDDWAAVAAAATGSRRRGAPADGPLLPRPGDPRFRGGGGSSGIRSNAAGRATAERVAAEQSRGDEATGKLWPSVEAIAGPEARPPAAVTSGGGPPGLIRALRGAQAADRQGRMLTGGGGLGAAAAPGAAPGGGRAAGQRGPGLADGQPAAGSGGGDEDLVPYVDVALKELGLPLRRSPARSPQGHARQQELYESRPYGSGSEDGEEYGNGGDDDLGSAGGEDEELGYEQRGGGGGRLLRSRSRSRSSPAAASSTTRSRGAKRGALMELLSAYQRVWCRALDLELQEEWTESEERLRSWQRSRLEAEGYALFDLTAAPDHNLFRDAILRFFLPGRRLPYHCLGAGDIVLVSPNNRPGEASLEGVVLDFSGRWIRVALPGDLAHGVQGSGWRVDLYANTIAHERARGAVKRFCQAAAESGSGSSSSKGSSGSDGDDNGGVGGGGSLGILRTLAGSVPPGASLEEMAAAAPPWLRGKAGRERLTAARRVVAAAAAAAVLEEQQSAAAAAAVAAVTGGKALPLPAGVAVTRTAGVAAGGDGGRRRACLNSSQARAVESALGRSLTLWQGPPGTGKTATLLQLARAVLAALPPGSGPVLATAASNVAVDNLVSGLKALEPGLDVVRVGQPVKVAAELRGISLEARVAGTPAGQRAARLRRQALGLRGSEAWAYISQALELEEAAAREILSRAQVVAATCIGCGEARMQVLSFPVVLLDEATQATEPHSLVPLLGQAQQVVLVGDPRQLPPTVKSREAAQLGLNLPLFERLQLMGLTPLLLDTQYRMHPAIAAFPSAAFYGGKLRSAPAPRDRRPPRGFPWPNPQVPVCFIAVRGRESRTNDADDTATPGGAAGYSYQNDDEAAAVVAVVAALLNPGSGLEGPGDIGVVTPYNGQVRRLTQLLTRGSRLSRGLGLGSRPGSFLRTAANSDDDGAEGWGATQGSLLEIKSVDGFQGREKEVIVFSAVRSNPEGRLGFLTDSRRLNVAITRARRGLLVVGNPDTLSRDRLWARWLKWAAGQGCVLEEGWVKEGTLPPS